MLLVIALCRSCGWLLHLVPAAIVVLLPTGAGVLIDVAIMAGIHVAVRRFSCRRVSVCRTGSRALAALGRLHRSCRPVSVGRVLGVGGIAILADYGLSPGAIGI